MGDTKHTPGPWLVSDGWEPNPHAVVDTQCVYGPPRIGVVAHVVMAAQDGGHREERKANARLIAAAPDLLTVAKAFVAKLDPAILVERDLPHSDLADELRAAIAAISRASR